MNCNIVSAKLHHVFLSSGSSVLHRVQTCHNNYVLAFVQKGNVTYFSRDSIFCLSEGQCIVLDNSSDIQVRASDESGYTAQHIVFSYGEPLTSNMVNHIFCVTDETELYVKAILKEDYHKQENYEQIISFGLTSLLLLLSRKVCPCASKCDKMTKEVPSVDTSQASPASSQKALVDHCLQLIQDNLYNQDLNVGFLTKRLYISPAYLHKLFNKFMHTSINKYIQNERLTRASDLLRDSSLPITAISEMLGYCSQCYFSTQFKKKMKVTPSDFRLANGIAVNM